MSLKQTSFALQCSEQIELELSDPDQTAPLRTVGLGSAGFAQIYPNTKSFTFFIIRPTV